MRPEVRPLTKHAYQLVWLNPPTTLTITFKYLIEKLNLTEPFVLQHYQGKPVGHRMFGYYDGHQYFSVSAEEVTHQCICQPIAIEDSVSYRPTAVNYFPDAEIFQTAAHEIIIRPKTKSPAET